MWLESPTSAYCTCKFFFFLCLAGSLSVLHITYFLPLVVWPLAFHISALGLTAHRLVERQYFAFAMQLKPCVFWRLSMVLNDFVIISDYQWKSGTINTRDAGCAVQTKAGHVVTLPATGRPKTAGRWKATNRGHLKTANHWQTTFKNGQLLAGHHKGASETRPLAIYPNAFATLLNRSENNERYCWCSSTMPTHKIKMCCKTRLWTFYQSRKIVNYLLIYTSD